METKVINVQNGIFAKAARAQAAFNNFMREVGKEAKTTFMSDLEIANGFGAKAVKDTYNRVMKEWMSNVEMITEFIMSLNHQSWYCSALGREELKTLYINLFYKGQEAFYNHYNTDSEEHQKARQYYFEMTD